MIVALGYKNKLFFDFYLPEYNLLIEYNGKQHYEPILFSSDMTWKEAKKTFVDQSKRDIIKVNYCKKNNYDLIVISYKKIKVIEEILAEYFYE